MIHTYTSTGSKLIHHPVVVNRIKRERLGTPVSLQIGPTSRCNLNCSFCSNANREKHEDLDREDLMDMLVKMKVLGLKTVEWTGGGDPTVYEYIRFMLVFADKINLEQGMITNGILLEKIGDDYLNRLTWLRISMNCLDYVDSINVPDIDGTLGFSYVMNEKTTDDILDRLDSHVKSFKPEYVRIVPNCIATDQEQRMNNLIYSQMVEDMGPPYFYQPKAFERSEKCRWGYFKPFLLHDGYVYPCSSVVLNSGSEGTFHEKYRWVKMAELPHVYEDDLDHFLLSYT